MSRRSDRRRDRRRKAWRRSMTPAQWRRILAGERITAAAKRTAIEQRAAAARAEEQRLAALSAEEQARVARKFDLDQRIAAEIVAVKAAYRRRDEQHARRVAAVADLPMTDVQWSPSSGRA